MKKYRNEQNVPMFGKYMDPYGERRGTGELYSANRIIEKADFPRHYDEGKLYCSWLGHSSVFLHMQKQNLLIDPVFSPRCSPVPFIGPKRFIGETIQADDLPFVDIVLITHSHYDHLDRKTIQALDNHVQAYIVPEGVGRILRRFGVDSLKIKELSWYESIEIKTLSVTLVPSQHDSGRSPFSMNRSLWGGFLLKTESYTVFISGDGGYAGHFKEICKRFGATDLAIMECGQYNEKWHAIHMFPEETVQACEDLQAKLSVPVHWGTYVLSDHAWDDPPKRFAKRADERGVQYQILDINQWLIL